MAAANHSRSPKRIRRILQMTAAGTVMLFSAIFGAVAMHTSAGSARASTPASQPVAAYNTTGAGAAAVATNAAGATTANAVSQTPLSATATAATPLPQTRTRAS